MQRIGEKLRNFGYQCLLSQLLFCIVFALFWALVYQKLEIFYSIMLGGLTCVVPNLYFAHKFFSKTGALAAKAIVNSFYKAEAVKLMLASTVFLIVFMYLDVRMVPFFMGYLVAHVGFWLGPIFLNKR